jgi:hypothetical protein
LATVDKVEGAVALGSTVKVYMREEFTGLMAPLITRSIPDLTPTFDEFAQCLKKAAEARLAG